LERVRYFARQLITAEDMRAEQEYFLERLRRHNRLLHGWGVVCGLEVQAATGNAPWGVRVAPGCAVSPQGDEICLAESQDFDLATGAADSASQTVFLAARFVEHNSHAVRVHPVGCACADGACEYSRILDDFESHTHAATADQQWCDAIRAWADTNNPAPVPPYTPAPADPWVVLASIQLPAQQTTALNNNAITYQNRRVLYSATALRLMALCLSTP
jgi:hypothetical protein